MKKPKDQQSKKQVPTENHVIKASSIWKRIVEKAETEAEMKKIKQRHH